MIKVFNKLVVFLTTATMILLLGCSVQPADIANTKQESNVDKLMDPFILQAGENLMLSSDIYELYLNNETMRISLIDKKNNTKWVTNPLSAENSDSLNSQFSLSYYDKNGNFSSMNSFADSVKKGQTKAYIQDNKLVVVYRLGKYNLTIESIPQKMSDSRFNKVLSKLSTEDAEKIKGYYKYYKSDDMWGIMSKGRNEFQKVYELLSKAGYKNEDLLKDNAQFGIPLSATTKPTFTVALEYKIDKEGFTVNIPTDKLVYPAEFPIYDISLFENLGKAERSNNGYLFVPDGCGALINFKDTNSQSEKLSIPIYGTDLTITSNALLAQGYNLERAVLPVFGMKDAGNSFLAIIESGAANTRIEAYRKGAYNNYNAIYPVFRVINKDNVYLAGAQESSKVTLFQNGMFKGDFSVKYVFLNGMDNDYSKMATLYREYLFEKGLLGSSQNDEKAIPLYIETIGGVSGYKNLLGISYIGIKPVTKYSQNIEIMKAIKEKGTQNIKVKLTGWFNGGVYHDYPSNIKLEHTLGGNKGFSEFLRYAKENGIEVFPDVNLQTAYNSTNGFFAPFDASRTIDLNEAKVYSISYATGERRTPNGLNNNYAYILSPAKLEGLTTKFLKGFVKLDTGGVSLRSSGNELYANYIKSGATDRVMSQELTEKSLEKIKNAVGSIMVSEGNSYAIPYSDHIVNIATASSGYSITDEDVPFLSMVLHGYKGMAGKPINLSSNYKKEALKAIEYGLSLHYQLTYEKSFLLKDTEYNTNYSSYYYDWISEIDESYKKVNQALLPVISVAITNHKKLMDGVYKTTYENGYDIYVNYSEKDVEINGINIKSMDFKTVKGDG